MSLFNNKYCVQKIIRKHLQHIKAVFNIDWTTVIWGSNSFFLQRMFVSTHYFQFSYHATNN